MEFQSVYASVYEKSIEGRYLPISKILPLLEKAGRQNEVRVIGRSVEDRPIHSCTIGNGPTRILLWSQMHGNESTTTKAVFDLFNFFDGNSEEAMLLKESCTFCFVPMLNPDGAERYTRVNANDVDLNRDMQQLTQPESRLLRSLHAEFRPHYCFNLHDQRTIFGVGTTGRPATVSFLAPSFDAARSMNDCRLRAIAVIDIMNETLQQIIPGQVGRFDDAFNLDCAGDTFQFLGTPTILVEAGHYPGDYQREKTRKCIFFALLAAFLKIHEIDIVEGATEKYLHIPQNMPSFFDFVYRNVRINYDNSELFTTFAAQFTETLIEDKIAFQAFIVKIDNLENAFGHVEYDANGARFDSDEGSHPQIGQKADFSIGGRRFVNGMTRTR